METKEAESKYLQLNNLMIKDNHSLIKTNQNDDEFFTKKEFLRKRKSIIDQINQSNNIVKEVQSLNKSNFDKFNDNEEQMLYIIYKSDDSSQCIYLNNKLKKDKNFAIKAVILDAFTLQYFDKLIRDDEDVVFMAVESNRLAFKYASERLRNNKKLALLALKNDGQPYSWIGKSLANDEELAKLAIISGGASMSAAGNRIRDNKEIMLEAIKKIGWNIKYASERLKDDKDLVLTSLEKDDWNLEYASERLQRDFDVINCLKDKRLKEEYLDKIKNLQKFNNDNIVSILKKDGLQLEYANNQIQDNKEIALIAINSNPYAFKFVSKRLKNDKDFVLQVLQKDGELYCYVGEECAKDLEVIKSAIYNTNYHYDIIEKIIDDGNNDIICDNKEIVKMIVSSTGSYLENASEKLRDDFEVVKSAVSNGHKEGDVIEYASERLRDNEDIVILSLLNEPDWYEEDGLSILKYVSDRLKNDKKIASLALKHNKTSKEYINDNLLKELCKKNKIHK